MNTSHFRFADTSTQQASAAAGVVATQQPPAAAGNIPALSMKPGWGDRLLPFLFAALETCCIDAILLGLANTNLLGTDKPLIPFWAPFLLIAVSYAISNRLAHRSKSIGVDIPSHTKHAHQPVMFLLALACTLLVIWASLYATTLFILDPAWLFNLPNTLLQFDTRAFQLLAIIAISTALWRHGAFIARQVIKPRQVFKMLRFGAIVIIMLIVIRALLTNMGKVLQDSANVLLIVALFFALTLISHALARVSSVRRYHRTGLNGNVTLQEQRLLKTITVLSLATLCIALSAGGFFNPALLAIFGQVLAPALTWLTGFNGHRSLKIPPMFNAAKKCTPAPVNKHSCIEGKSIHVPSGQLTHTHLPVSQPISAFLSPELVAFLLFALLLIFVSIVLLFSVRILLYLRKRRHQLRGELHESLWSWPLFQHQLRQFLHALLTRLLPWKAREARQRPAMMEELNLSTPTASTIREIYRSLLSFAADRGLQRAQNETPYEFRMRLAQAFPCVEPQLTVITEAYITIRYGGSAPAQKVVEHLHSTWVDLQQKWQASL